MTGNVLEESESFSFRRIARFYTTNRPFFW